jgi:DNA-binding NarL/FixJ family response regulator
MTAPAARQALRPDGTALTVLAIDDHEVVRLGLATLLSRRHEVLNWLEAGSVGEALRRHGDAAPNLVLLDLCLGEELGLPDIPRLAQTWPGARILVLSSLPEDRYAEPALRAGADGYLMKSELAATLNAAVDIVLKGEPYLSERQRGRTLKRLLARDVLQESRPELSPRELEVLRGVANGRSTREIAEALNRSVKTIETHKQALKTKLGAASPAQLVRLAIDWFGPAA